MDKLFIALQHFLPQHFLSACMHKLTRSEIPWLKSTIIKLLINRFKMNMEEAVESDPEEYKSVNAFFTRHLNEQAREFEDAKDTIASPVDGVVSQAGVIDNSEIFQAKGKSFNVTALLGSADMATQFEGGHFTTIYLSPKDYHRIHFPVDGTLTKMIHVPGDLFSVNPTTTEAIDGLFARNERVVSFFDTPAGPMAMVMVGAIFVSSIETVWQGEVTPPRHNQVRSWTYSDKNLSYKKNDEMGHFNMGSTIVMLYAKDAIAWNDSLAAEKEVQLGQVIGTIANPK